MNIINEFNLVVDAKSVNEGFCRTVVSSFIASLDPNIEELSDLKTAVSEAVTNAIVHAYPEISGKVYITGEITGESIVRVKIKDKGIGIEDIHKAMEPLYSTGNGDRAGLGFTVMQSFCDRVSVKSKVGVGTAVTLTKRIHGKKW